MHSKVIQLSRNPLSEGQLIHKEFFDGVHFIGIIASQVTELRMEDAKNYYIFDNYFAGFAKVEYPRVTITNRDVYFRTMYQRFIEDAKDLSETNYEVFNRTNEDILETL